MGGIEVADFVANEPAPHAAQSPLPLTSEKQRRSAVNRAEMSEDETRIGDRQDANNLLLALIAQEMKWHPDRRFLQILTTSGILDGADRFYEEPWDTVIRMHEGERNPSVRFAECQEMQVHLTAEIEKLRDEIDHLRGVELK